VSVDPPPIYIAIGQVACARFTAGDTFEQVSDELLIELAGTNPGDDEQLVGAILEPRHRPSVPNTPT
jgi:hypothetical protein